MKKTLLLLLILALGMTAWAQNIVIGVEANGTDSATMKAYEWRKPNVYDKMYGNAGFKVVDLNQSSKSKVENALKSYKVTHIAGCGHGSPTRYTGYRTQTVFSTSDTTLLKKLAGTHIHLLSCLTAQQLGPAMVKNGAKSYAGYHPSFYFTWKSAHLFFEADAAIDNAFAHGKSAPQAYDETIKKFNEIMAVLQEQEPDAVKYIITDRDGLRCIAAKYDSRSTKLDYVFPLDVVTNTLYAKDPQTEQFVSFADYHNLNLRSSYRGMSTEEFKEMVIAGYEKLNRDFELGIISHGKFHRDRLIDEIRRGTELGKQLIAIDKHFVEKLSQARLTKTVKVKTDGEGNIVDSGSFDVPMTITVKGVEAKWQGAPDKFSNVTVILRDEKLYDGAVVNGKKYDLNKKVQKGAASYAIKAVGGPKSTEVAITLHFSLW